MLILAGVSISLVLGPNGLITKAQEAALKTEEAQEKEEIEQSILLAKMNEYLDSSDSNHIGTPLYDKNLANGDIWNIIVDSNQKVYGTGWNFIGKGTNIADYGEATKSWLINYDSGEIVELEEGTYTNLSYASSLAVTEGLVFNVDPMNMSDSSSWGEGVTLYGFEDNEEDSWTGNSLKFDGVNDYITIDGNLDVEDEITIEFYGKINNYYETEYQYSPLLSAYSNTKVADVEGLCMRIWARGKNISTNFGYVSCGNSNIWEGSGGPHNIIVNCDIKLNNDFMYTTTYNHSTCMYSVYMNGNLIKQEKLDENYWNNFKENEIPNIEYFQIGKARWNSITGYFNGDMYSARIYNKCLNSDEVLENYNKTVAYHNLNSN